MGDKFTDVDLDIDKCEITRLLINATVTHIHNELSKIHETILSEWKSTQDDSKKVSLKRLDKILPQTWLE